MGQQHRGSFEKKGFFGALSARRGQMSLVLLVIVAVALMFFAMAVNWKIVSKNKVTTTMAANMGAAQMASQISSYGNYFVKQQLDNHREKTSCQFFLMAILAVILIIVGIILLGAGGQTLIEWGILMLGVSAAVIAVQQYYLNTNTVTMWNKMQRNIKTTEGRFLEGGLSVAMQSAIDDTEPMPDLYDYDQNGLWYNTLTNTGNSKEKIARLSYFYTERLRNMKTPKQNNADEFLAAAKALAEKLGLDSTANNCSACSGDIPGDARCNPCCQELASRPKTCDQTAIPAECSTSSKTPGYPLSYDPLFCTRQDITRLPGLFGQDDPSKHILKTRAQDVTSQELADTNPKYRGTDAEGEMFSLLWMLKDSSPEVSMLNATTVKEDSESCHWCAPSSTGTTPPTCQSTDTTGFYWGSYGQLDLPNACSGDGCCVNVFNNDRYNLSSVDTRLIDKVGTISGFSTTVPWIKGSPLMCTEAKEPGAVDTYAAPYMASSCIAYTKDIFDDISIQAKGVALALQNILSSNSQDLAANIDQWYKEADELFKSLNGTGGLKELLIQVRDSINSWRNASYADAGAWCVPVETAQVPSDEYKTIMATGDTWGSLDSVVACLAYNSNNHEKFDACAKDSTKCKNLPRSLVPGFDPNGAQGPDYEEKIKLSAYLAQNQSKKFMARRVYLEELKNKADAVADLFNNMIVAIGDPNTGVPKLKELLEAIKKAEENAAVNDPDNWMIYGWKSAPPKGKKEGNWHLVKLQGFLPRKCAGYDCCRSDNKLPWVKATKFEKGLSTCRRYRLESVSGRVKMSVTRFDEDSRSPIQLLSGVKLWNFSYSAKGSGAQKSLEDCVVSWERSFAGDAFMVNTEAEFAAKSASCQGAISDALKAGVKTDSCAIYYMDGDKYKIQYYNCNTACEKILDFNDEK